MNQTDSFLLYHVNKLQLLNECSFFNRNEKQTTMPFYDQYCDSVLKTVRFPIIIIDIAHLWYDTGKYLFMLPRKIPSKVSENCRSM